MFHLNVLKLDIYIISIHPTITAMVVIFSATMSMSSSSLAVWEDACGLMDSVKVTRYISDVEGECGCLISP